MMDSSPRRWILKSLSPLLQPSDLRTILNTPQSEAPNLEAPENSAVLTSKTISVTRNLSSGAVSCRQGDASADAVVDDGQVAVSEDSGSTSDEWRPSSPSSSISSNSGFYSFVEDPTSLEAELNEAWMISPQRQAQLLTFKEDKSFKLQTYTSTRKPKSLFQEVNEDLSYDVDTIRVVGEEEEKELRKEIIRSQAPKKSLTFKKSSEDLNQSSDTKFLTEGFSLCYSPVGSKPDVALQPDPGTIDQEQINFRAARLQFLKMEDDQQNAFLDPRKCPKTPQHVSAQQDSNLFSVRTVEFEDTVDAVHKESKPLKALDVGKTFALRKEKEHLTEEKLMFDEWDSQLELLETGGGGDTGDTGPSVYNIQQQHRNSKSTSERETPIEREIRLIQEREVNLRRSRGLMASDSRAEIVEIKTKYLQGPPVPFKAKDKNRVSFITKSEIQESQQQGRILGQYPQDPPEEPVERKKDEDMRTDDILRPVEAEAFLSPCCPHRHTEETELYISTMSSGPTYTSLGGLEVQSPHTSSRQDLVDLKRTQADHFVLSPIVVTDGGDKLDSPQIGEIVSSSSSHCSSSLSPPSTDCVLLTPQTTTSTWSTPCSWRESRAYRAPDFIGKEIEEGLRREEELRHQRESRRENPDRPLFPPLPEAQQENKMNISHVNMSATLSSDTDSGSLCFGETAPPPGPRLSKPSRLSSHPAVRPSVSITAQPWTGSRPPSSTSRPVASSSLPPPLSPLVVGSGPPQRGLAGVLLQEFEETRAKLKLEESSYAGIQPVDNVNNEVVESTRVTRHKNQRALRWEAGIFANQQGQ